MYLTCVGYLPEGSLSVMFIHGQPMLIANVWLRSMPVSVELEPMCISVMVSTVMATRYQTVFSTLHAACSAAGYLSNGLARSLNDCSPNSWLSSDVKAGWC